MPPSPLTVGVAAAERRADALRLVLGDMEEAAREDLVQQLLAASTPGAFDGLLEARCEGRPIGAVWAQMHPGGVASLWPPVLCRAEQALPEGAAERLLEEACRYLRAAGASLAQAVLPPEARQQADLLTSARFVWMADLLYLASNKGRFPRTSPAASLQFDRYRPEEHERLKRVIARTYCGTLDCPRLSGMRHMDDVLRGYRATGEFRPSWWLIVRDGSRDIGCLLLTDHPPARQVELIYMGIVPEARGRGLGIAITGHAQWLTRRAGRSRIVLAVDASNGPALAMYDATGFMAWAKRRVFMRPIAEQAKRE